MANSSQSSFRETGYINTFVNKIFARDHEQTGVDVEAALPNDSEIGGESKSTVSKLHERNGLPLFQPPPPPPPPPPPSTAAVIPSKSQERNRRQPDVPSPFKSSTAAVIPPESHQTNKMQRRVTSSASGWFRSTAAVIPEPDEIDRMPTIPLPPPPPPPPSVPFEPTAAVIPSKSHETNRRQPDVPSPFRLARRSQPKVPSSSAIPPESHETNERQPQVPSPASTVAVIPEPNEIDRMPPPPPPSIPFEPTAQPQVPSPASGWFSSTAAVIPESHEVDKLPAIPPPPPPSSRSTVLKVHKSNKTQPPQISKEAAQMFKTALRGDWGTAEKWFEEDEKRIKEAISSTLEGPLHAAVGTGTSNLFVQKLLDRMGDDDKALALKDCNDETALHHAARVGNREATIMLVNRKPDLMYMTNSSDRLPVQIAAIHCQKETLIYLIEKSEEEANVVVENSPFVGNLGVRLLMAVIAAGFFDVALHLVDKYPDLARISRKEVRNSNSGSGSGSYSSSGSGSGLSTLAGMSSAFQNGESCGFWYNLIYSRVIPLESSSRRSTMTVPTAADDNAPNSRKSGCSIITKLSQKLGAVINKAVQDFVPHAESIGRKKLMHQQALELAKSLCEKIEYLPHDEASDMYEESIIIAAKNGIPDVVREIAEISPTSIFAADPDTGRNIFSIAAAERHENVFNLLYDMSDRKFNFFDGVDDQGNSFMHLCANIAPSRKLDLVPGPARQMQRELQWFKEVERFVHPSRREWPNDKTDTPRMLFSKEHENLKTKGEEWMRSTANSCSVAAALVATIMFAAAFTVPGGINSETGIPIFRDKFPFMIFIVSDVVSLFTSLTSLLMFLSILTSRYAEEDFLYVLPRRSSIGLVALFASITFMMTAFGAALYLMLVEKDAWLLIPVAALACLPIGTFMLLQFPLLRAVVSSTYNLWP